MGRGTDTYHREDLAKLRTTGGKQYLTFLCKCVSLGKSERTEQKKQPVFIQHVHDLYDEQEGKCALTGLEMTFNNDRCYPYQISMDRIDGSKGYVVGNIRLVCANVNHMLGPHDENTLLHVAEACVAYGPHRDWDLLTPDTRCRNDTRDGPPSAKWCKRVWCTSMIHRRRASSRFV